MSLLDVYLKTLLQQYIYVYDRIDSSYVDIISVWPFIFLIFLLDFVYTGNYGDFRWVFLQWQIYTLRWTYDPFRDTFRPCLIYVFEQTYSYTHITANFNSTGDFMIFMLFDFNSEIVLGWKRKFKSLQFYLDYVDK